MSIQRIGDYQALMWFRQQAEENARKRNLKVPSEIKDKAYWLGFRWGMIIFAILMTVWGIDSASGLNIISPVDVTTLYNYYVPAKNVRVIKPRAENDSTFVVDIPVKDVCCKVDIQIPKGRCIYAQSVTPIGVTLPEWRRVQQKNLRFTSGKYGGLTTEKPGDKPAYITAHALYKYSTVMNKFSNYGAPMMIVDNLAFVTEENFRRKSKSGQLYVGVNIENHWLLEQANGFYRVKFVISRKCPEKSWLMRQRTP